LVKKLTNPPPVVPREAVFRPASPPLPDIGFPDEIPGLSANQVVRLGRMVGTMLMTSWTLMG